MAEALHDEDEISSYAAAMDPRVAKLQRELTDGAAIGSALDMLSLLEDDMADDAVIPGFEDEPPHALRALPKPLPKPELQIPPTAAEIAPEPFVEPAQAPVVVEAEDDLVAEDLGDDLGDLPDVVPQGADEVLDLDQDEADVVIDDEMAETTVEETVIPDYASQEVSAEELALEDMADADIGGADLETGDLLLEGMPIDADADAEVEALAEDGEESLRELLALSQPPAAPAEAEILEAALDDDLDADLWPAEMAAEPAETAVAEAPLPDEEDLFEAAARTDGDAPLDDLFGFDAEEPASEGEALALDDLPDDALSALGEVLAAVEAATIEPWAEPPADAGDPFADLAPEAPVLDAEPWDIPEAAPAVRAWDDPADLPADEATPTDMIHEESMSSPTTEEQAPAAETAAPAAKKGLFALFGRKPKLEAAPEGQLEADAAAEPTEAAETDEADNGAEATAGESVTAKKKSSTSLLAIAPVLVAATVGGGYLALPYLAGPQPVRQVTAEAPPAEVVPDAGLPAPTPVAAEAPAADAASADPVAAEAPADVPAEAAPIDAADDDLEDLAALAAPVPQAPEGSSDKADVMVEPDFVAGLDDPAAGELDDLFIRAGDEPAAPVVAMPEIDLENYVPREDFDALLATAEEMAARMDELEAAIATRDADTVQRDAIVRSAAEQAARAEELALAQNQMIVAVVALKDKMDTAEELVVDLSERVASLESVDPADRAAVEDSLVDLDQRVEGLARDVGLVARMAINGGGRIPASADPRAEARGPVAEAEPVYDAAQAEMATPGVDPSLIPSDVEPGMIVEGYGAVLDVIPTSDGSRLVVMENGSAVIE